MRPSLARIVVASATCLAVLAQSAWANWGHDRVETVYVDPTPTTMLVPSTYAVAMPATYTTTSATLLPATYAYTTASYAPVATSYYATSYGPVRPARARRLARRAIYETTTYSGYDPSPTTIYLPTSATFGMPLVTTSAVLYDPNCRTSQVAFNPPAPVATGASKSFSSTVRGGEPNLDDAAKKQAAAAEAARTRDAAVEAARTKEETKDKTAADPKDKPPIVEPADAGTTPADPSPPPAPAPEKDKKDEPLPPVGDEPKAADRINQRPAATVMRGQAGAAARNVLRGVVVSGVTDKPMGSMKVSFSDLSRNYADRVKDTDAKGAFEVFLPNGDWSIVVEDPAAAKGVKPKVLGRVTATGGKYLDDDDRPIYSLRLYN